MNDVTLITPTHDRPIALKLCMRWMNAQDFRGNVKWIIVEDGKKGSPANFNDCQEKLDLLYLHRKAEPGEKGPKSLAANLFHALQHVETEKIIIIEDDDYYWPNHVGDMAKRLDYADITGPIWQKYYNVPARMYIVQKNIGSALCSTGFKRCLLPALQRACRKCYNNDWKGIDRIFWDSTKKNRRDLYDVKNQSCIGIKGLPGSAGIGHGHDPKNSMFKYKQDPTGKVLKAWVGREIGEMYLRRFSYG